MILLAGSRKGAKRRDVAQMVARTLGVGKVAGSNPAVPTRPISCLGQVRVPEPRGSGTVMCGGGGIGRHAILRG